MATAATLSLMLAAAIVLVPASVLFVECALATLGPRRPRGSRGGPRPSVAVLVPAHDEQDVIEGTVRGLLPELAPGDRLLVVADNCTDRTAERARAAGATVVERRDPERRGKGYALDYGVRQLAARPPDVVVVVDADCALQPGSLESLARAATAEGRPAQARNLVVLPEGASALDTLSAFAFLVRNVVRPTGLGRLGLPCHLMGTGMALPWPLVRDAPLATGALAEDLELGLALTRAGRGPVLCSEALVTSPVPRPRRARETQRRRWEQGHVTVLLTLGPGLLWRALRRLDVVLLAAALDLCVPPLSLLLLAAVAVLAAALAAGALGSSWTPALLGGLAVGLVGLSALLAWLAFGRPAYRFTTLLVAPLYVLAKVPLYLALLGRRQQGWVRTEREPGPPDRPPGP